jgi:hypothetical protein
VWFEETLMRGDDMEPGTLWTCRLSIFKIRTAFWGLG